MMTESRAAWIQTMADEPDLLLEPGETAPVFDAATIREARAICAQVERETLH